MELKINMDCDYSYKRSLNLVIEQLSQGLELENLEYIIVPKDFSSELHSFQRERGLKEEFTNDGYEIAMGKQLSYDVDGELKYSIFIDPRLLLDSEIACSAINHELCHVHGQCMKLKMFGPSWLNKADNDLKNNLRKVADDIWSEYLASRLSMRKIEVGGKIGLIASPQTIDWHISLLLDEIPQIKEETEKSTREYWDHRDINRVLNEVTTSAQKLLKSSARIYGYIHALNERDFEEHIYEGIEQTYFEEIWTLLGPVFQDLYNKYPRWENEEEFDGLAEIVLKTWILMGVYPKDLGQGKGWFVYVHEY